MKYVQGRPLDSVIRDVGPLPIPMVQAIVAQVGDALGYAHRHGVIHRDVKSANIMLDEEGWAVVTDFGIAKVLQAEGLTMTGVTVGTPTYMSPEQIGTHEVTGASDQYSLGVVAYEMLTGKLPFHGESIMSVMYAHFNEPARPVTELRPDCPPNLAAAVMRMLEKDAARRWPSMDDVVAVCGRPSLRQDDPIRSEMVTLARAGAGARVLAQIKTPTSPIALARSQPHAAAAAVPRARRGPRLWWGLGVVGIAAALWWVAPWRGSRVPTVPGPGTGPDTVGARHAGAARGGAAGRAGARGWSGRPAAANRAGDRRLRAGAGIARPERSPTRLSRSHVGPAAGLEGPVSVGAHAQGQPDGDGGEGRRRDGRSDRQRRLRVRKRPHGSDRAPSGDVPRDPRRGARRVASRDRPLIGFRSCIRAPRSTPRWAGGPHG